LNEPPRCYTQTQLGAFHDAIRKSVFYANVNADRRRFDRDGRNESPERSLRFQLGYRLGSGLRKQAFVKLVRRVRSSERPSYIRPRFKNSEGVVGVHSLNRRKARVFHDIYGTHPQHHFVFNNENFGRGLVQDHIVIAFLASH
jgi:hypothetical protein